MDDLAVPLTEIEKAELLMAINENMTPATGIMVRRALYEIGQLREMLAGLAKRHEGYEHACGPCICEWHEKARAHLSEKSEGDHG